MTPLVPPTLPPAGPERPRVTREQGRRGFAQAIGAAAVMGLFPLLALNWPSGLYHIGALLAQCWLPAWIALSLALPYVGRRTGLPWYALAAPGVCTVLALAVCYCWLIADDYYEDGPAGKPLVQALWSLGVLLIVGTCVLLVVAGIRHLQASRESNGE